jgi:hypothetical protein
MMVSFSHPSLPLLYPPPFAYRDGMLFLISERKRGREGRGLKNKNRLLIFQETVAFAI